MRDHPIRQAHKLKSDLYMVHTIRIDGKRTLVIQLVRQFMKWGKNYILTTETGDYTVPDVYLLKRLTAQEKKQCGLTDKETAEA